jgi:uncharacterized protein (DUF302 family)
VTKSSRHPFSDTVAMLSDAIVAAGNTLFATIDQAAAARDAGLSLRPTTLLVFGNPKGGTPLMQAAPLFALELPLKLLVWQDDGGVHVAYTPMSEIAARYGIDDPRIAAMDRALAALASVVS